MGKWVVKKSFRISLCIPSRCVCQKCAMCDVGGCSGRPHRKVLWVKHP